VVHVTANEAARYCAARGARLPTADEWEFAARGPERRVFPWGDEWDRARLRSGASPSAGVAPVGSHPDGGTPDGIHDLAGNVWEWTATESEVGRVIKGGSWDAKNPAYFRAAAISEVDAMEPSSDVGFRCVRDAAG
jgi:formylglycine-generating enzyme required for sulfatase activity